MNIPDISGIKPIDPKFIPDDPKDADKKKMNPVELSVRWIAYHKWELQVWESAINFGQVFLTDGENYTQIVFKSKMKFDTIKAKVIKDLKKQIAYEESQLSKTMSLKKNERHLDEFYNSLMPYTVSAKNQ